MITQDRKVVELLRLLGDDLAESVLAKLRPERASQLRKQIESAPPAPLSAQRRLQILEEFDRFFELLKPEPGQLRVHRPEADEDASPTEPKRTGKRFVPSGDHLRDLERMNLHQVAGAMEQEQPRNVAAILNQLAPERTAEILSLFHDAKREGVVKELSAATRAHPQLVQRMAQSLVTRALTMPTEPLERIDRIQRLASVLRAVDKPLRRQMFEAIQEQDAETAEALLDKLYIFSDLAQLSDRQMQRLLGEVDSNTISIALFQADAAIRSKVLGNLSRRAREALEDEMQFQSDVPMNQVETARTLVARTIAKIDQDGG
jgi:flagellar motor switch protein FliG